MLALYLFWIGIAIVFYTYIGYGILLYVLCRFKSKKPGGAALTDQYPEVTLVIAAFNEESFIQKKIDDVIALDYPAEKLSVFFVTDGSTDQTPEIIRNYSQFSLFHEPGRKGKIHAVNRIMPFVKTPFTVFCDANTLLNKEAIRKLIRHYENPSVGGVAGEKRIYVNAEDNATGSGEGLYWKYESFLKRKDAELYSVVGAAGELFSIRTELFDPPEENMIIEDFYLSMRIVGRGFRFEYEPEAFAIETSSASVDEEWKRKVRICAGAFQAMPRLTYLLNPFRYGILAFQYFSHRVLRWTLAPLFLPILFISNFFLAWQGDVSFYQIAFALQVSFYLIAWLGYLFRNKNVSLKGFFVPYYFIVMNAAVYAGFFRHLAGRQSVVWEQAKRSELKVK